VSSIVASGRDTSAEPSSRGAWGPEAWELIVVAALTVVALALRVTQIDQTLAGDELFTYHDVVGRSFGAVLTTVNTGGENSPPLFFVLAWASAKLGNATVWIRLPSVVLGVATVPIVYAIGRETVGRIPGVIAAIVMALAPFTVFYGIEARPYATMMFFVALSTLAMVRALRSESRRWWLVYALSAAAAAYSHYTAIFVLAVQATYSIWAGRDRLRRPLGAAALIIALYVPWLPNLRGKELGVIGALYPLGVHRVLTDLLRPIPGDPSAPLSAIPTLPGLIAFLACIAGGLLALTVSVRAQPPSLGAHRLPSGLPLLAALAAVTPIGLLAYSLLVTDLWLPRGLSASIPAAALVVGTLLAMLPGRLSALSVIVLIVVLALGTIRSVQPAYNRGPFRTIAAYLDRVAGPRDTVRIYSFAGGPAMLVEFRKPHLIANSIGQMWRLTGPGGTAFLVLDQLIARARRIGTPIVSGFRIEARKHYGGTSSTDLLIYRRDAP
jgi:Dolichyl-phosphate-mannose-protein mannosyltransferase